jgi:uncharacterized membrane protein YdjX (TVP38/TMEM64 family)
MPDAAPNLESPSDRKTWLRWLILFLIVAALAGFYALGLQEYFDWDYVRSHLTDFKAWVADHYLFAIAAFFILYAVITGLSLPVAPILSLLAGALFGRFLGTGIVLLAATVGSTLAFLSSRFLLRDWVQRRFGSRRLQVFNRGVAKDGAYYLLTLRLVPLFPFFLINLGMGLTAIRTWTYFWVSLFGMLPGTFLYVNAGQALATLESPRDILSAETIFSLALLGVLPLLIRWGLARFRRKDGES